MILGERGARGARRLLVAAAAIGGLLIVSTVSAASVLPLPINSDPYTNSSSQHQTQLEPDSFAFGNTVVSVTQSGRFYNGGSRPAWVPSALLSKSEPAVSPSGPTSSSA